MKKAFIMHDIIKKKLKLVLNIKIYMKL